MALSLMGGLAQAADQPVYAPPAAWVTPHEPAKPIGPDTTTPTRILLSDSQIRFDGAAREAYAETVVKIQTPQGLSGVGNLALAWKPDTDTLTIHKLRIIRGDQVIDLLANGRTFTVLRRENNLEMAMLDGTLTAAIQPEGLQVGDLLDLAVTAKRVDPVLNGHAESLMGNLVAVPIDRLIYRELWPKTETLRFRQTDGLAAAKIAPTADGSELTIAMDKAEPPKAPKGAPARYFELGQIEGTDFRSWAEVSALMAPLFEKASALTDASPLKAEAAKIKAASKDPKVQAMAALKLVEDQVRYLFLGMNNGGYVPADADQTWSRRFGDCKGKTALLIALLHELGIEAEPALASILHGDGLDERLPMLEIFDHVLVRAVIGGKVYWLDGTRSGDRTLDDLPVPALHWLLPVQKSGAELVKLTIPVPDKPLVATDIQIDASNGIYVSVPVRATATFRADPGIVLNLQLKSATPENLDKALRGYWKKALDWVDIAKVGASYDEKTGEERLTMDGAGKMEWKNYQGGARKEYEIDGGVLGWRADFDREPGSKQDAPFTVGVPFFSETKETIKLPPGGIGFSIDSTDTDRAAAGFAFKRVTRIEDSALTMTAIAKAVIPEFPASAAAQAKADLREMADVAVYLHAPDFVPNTEFTQVPQAPVLTLSPDVVEALIESCRNAAMDGKHLDAALAECQRALKHDPDSDDAKMGRALVYLRTQRFEAAMADYRDVLRRRPNSPTAHFGLGQAELKSGASANGNADLAAARAQNPNIDSEFYGKTSSPATPNPVSPKTPEGLITQGRLLASQGSPDQALLDFNAAIKLDPKSSEAYAYRGFVYLKLNQTDLAGDDFGEALNLDTTKTLALKGKAIIAEKKGDWPGVLALLTRMLELKPDEVGLRVGRAEALVQLHRYDDALTDMNSALGKMPNNPVWLNDRCWYRAIAGKELAIALDDCNASLRIKEFAATHDSRGLVDLRLGKFDDAVADYDKALTLHPNMPSSLYGRGIAKLRKGATTDGKADMTAGLAIDPKVEKQFAGYGVTP
ncbi:MAG TPA: tetratricopeptide repeat protein [Alphaproteobacteria bacterium]|nr:tetratricopeptide repeat protein [Alphaproteobacteria bacterium]